MFRKAAGFRADYHYLHLVVAPDFDEWRVFLRDDGIIIHGGRQFTEIKAKEAARQIADAYLHDEKHEDLPPLPEVQWTPMQPGEWLNFHP